MHNISFRPWNKAWGTRDCKGRGVFTHPLCAIRLMGGLADPPQRQSGGVYTCIMRYPTYRRLADPPLTLQFHLFGSFEFSGQCLQDCHSNQAGRNHCRWFDLNCVHELCLLQSTKNFAVSVKFACILFV